MRDRSRHRRSASFSSTVADVGSDSEREDFELDISSDAADKNHDETINNIETSVKDININHVSEICAENLSANTKVESTKSANCNPFGSVDGSKSVGFYSVKGRNRLDVNENEVKVITIAPTDTADDTIFPSVRDIKVEKEDPRENNANRGDGIIKPAKFRHYSGAHDQKEYTFGLLYVPPSPASTFEELSAHRGTNEASSDPGMDRQLSENVVPAKQLIYAGPMPTEPPVNLITANPELLASPGKVLSPEQERSTEDQQHPTGLPPDKPAETIRTEQETITHSMNEKLTSEEGDHSVTPPDNSSASQVHQKSAAPGELMNGNEDESTSQLNTAIKGDEGGDNIENEAPGPSSDDVTPNQKSDEAITNDSNEDTDEKLQLTGKDIPSDEGEGDGNDTTSDSIVHNDDNKDSQENLGQADDEGALDTNSPASSIVRSEHASNGSNKDFDTDSVLSHEDDAVNNSPLALKLTPTNKMKTRSAKRPLSLSPEHENVTVVLNGKNEVKSIRVQDIEDFTKRERAFMSAKKKRRIEGSHQVLGTLDATKTNVTEVRVECESQERGSNDVQKNDENKENAANTDEGIISLEKLKDNKEQIPSSEEVRGNLNEQDSGMSRKSNTEDIGQRDDVKVAAAAVTSKNKKTSAQEKKKGRAVKEKSSFSKNVRATRHWKKRLLNKQDDQKRVLRPARITRGPITGTKTVTMDKNDAVSNIMARRKEKLSLPSKNKGSAQIKGKDQKITDMPNHGSLKLKDEKKADGTPKRRIIQRLIKTKSRRSRQKTVSHSPNSNNTFRLVKVELNIKEQDNPVWKCFLKKAIKPDAESGENIGSVAECQMCDFVCDYFGDVASMAKHLTERHHVDVKKIKMQHKGDNMMKDRMPKLKSYVWNFFVAKAEKGEERPTCTLCTLCGESVPYAADSSTSNMHQHLKTAHKVSMDIKHRRSLSHTATPKSKITIKKNQIPKSSPAKLVKTEVPIGDQDGYNQSRRATHGTEVAEKHGRSRSTYREQRDTAKAEILQSTGKANRGQASKPNAKLVIQTEAVDSEDENKTPRKLGLRSQVEKTNSEGKRNKDRDSKPNNSPKPITPKGNIGSQEKTKSRRLTLELQVERKKQSLNEENASKLVDMELTTTEKQSPVWICFKKKGMKREMGDNEEIETCISECQMCDMSFYYSENSSTELMIQHLDRKHNVDVSKISMDEKYSLKEKTTTRRVKSRVWNFFIRKENQPTSALCVLCGSSVKYPPDSSTSQMRNHLSSAHNMVVPSILANKSGRLSCP